MGGGKSRLVVINDGSKDNTLLIGQSLLKDMPYLRVFNKRNSGHGATVLYGYRYAVKSNADFIFQTDSDGQTCPSEFEKFWEARNDYDAVMGYRNHRQDGLSRIMVTKVLRLVLYIIFGLKITDANTPYRLMRRSLLVKYIPNIPKNFNLSNVMLTVLFLYHDEKVQFLPITFKPRQGGKNSINIPRIVKIGIKAVKDFYFISKNLKKHDKTEGKAL